MPRLTHARLLEVLIYDPISGSFTNRITRSPRALQGKPAGGLNLQGYLMISIDGEQHRANRLAWFYMTGEWPPGHIDVDHKDVDQGNNKWANLRIATAYQSRGNTRKRKDNTTGYKGVTWDKSKGKYMAQIQVKGRCKFLGRFNSAEEAAAAYKTGAKIYFEEFARS